MNKQILIFLICLLLIPSVLASTPAYDISNTFNNEIINGDNDIGELVFTARPYIPGNINFSTYTAGLAQQYDLLTWLGNESIIITSPLLEDTVLVKGSSYYVNTVGRYDYNSLLNSSFNGYMTISQKDNNNIQITNIIQPSGFIVDFSTDTFTIIDEEVISVNVIVDDDVATGDYDISFDVNGETQTHQFEVLENLDWNIKEDNISSNYTVVSGENRYAGFVILENAGNADIEISVEKSGNNKHLFIIPQTQTLYKKSELRLEFSIQVPTTQSPDTATIDVNVFGGDKNESKQINITIIDSILPIIESINFSTDKAFKQNTISIIAIDNNEVANVSVTYDGRTIYFDKDEQLFTQTISFNKLSRYLLDFCAYDYDNNEKCLEVEKTFIETDLIVGEETHLILPSKKVSQYSQIYLFNITETSLEGINVLLSDFVPTTSLEYNDSYTIRLIDGDGAVKSFTKYNNEINLVAVGEIFLEVRSSEIADYNGVLSIIQPDYASTISDIRFEVSFKDYDVPNDFVKPWNHDTELSCVVIDTGNLDDTHYECIFDAPITIRPEDISVPTTIGEREAFENRASEVEEKLKKSKRVSGTLISFLIAVLLILSGLSYYMIYHFPYVRISSGHKLKYKFNQQGDKKYDR